MRFLHVGTLLTAVFGITYAGLSDSNENNTLKRRSVQAAAADDTDFSKYTKANEYFKRDFPHLDMVPGKTYVFVAEMDVPSDKSILASTQEAISESFPGDLLSHQRVVVGRVTGSAPSYNFEAIGHELRTTPDSQGVKRIRYARKVWRAVYPPEADKHVYQERTMRFKGVTDLSPEDIIRAGEEVTPEGERYSKVCNNCRQWADRFLERLDISPLGPDGEPIRKSNGGDRGSRRPRLRGHCSAMRSRR